MILNTWGDVLSSSFQSLGQGVLAFIPSLIVALIIVAIGWAIGMLIGKAIEQFVKAIKFDEALRQAGFEDVVRKAGLNLNTGKFLGKLVEYFIIAVFLIASFSVLHLDPVTLSLQTIVLVYLPQIIIAVLILLVSGVVGDVMSRIVTASSRTAGLTSANFLGALTKWIIWIFALLLALAQLNIGGPYIQTLFTGIVVAVSLAFGLAFGLGGQQAASRTIERIQNEISTKR